MLLIFCADPLRSYQPDSAYKTEVAAAKNAHFNYALLDFEALVYQDNAKLAVQKIPLQETTAIYRGWMLKPAQYQKLYEALLEKGIRLINDPDAYQHCHYLPEYYAVIEEYTPESVWLKLDSKKDFSPIFELLRQFGDSPLIVKDYVKSQKYYWNEACYIPAASDKAAVAQVVERFLDLQGNDLNEGLVFRQFVELKKVGKHIRSEMPLHEEYRLFFMDGNIIFTAPHWNTENLPPPPKTFLHIAQHIKSRFFTMDIARTEENNWLIVELGDGQVSGLPENANPAQFYAALAKA